MTKQYKVSFAISEETQNRTQKLPRSVNISEKLRAAYEAILDELIPIPDSDT